MVATDSSIHSSSMEVFLNTYLQTAFQPLSSEIARIFSEIAPNITINPKTDGIDVSDNELIGLPEQPSNSRIFEMLRIFRFDTTEWPRKYPNNQAFSAFFNSNGTDTMFMLGARLVFDTNGDFIPEASEVPPQLRRLTYDWANKLSDEMGN